MYVDKPVGEMSGEEEWAVYFQYLTNEAKREKIEEIIDREEGIAMATSAMCEITANEVEYARLTTDLKNMLDWQAGMVGAKREGLQEGLEAVARNALAQGASLDFVQKITGLDMETIKQLAI